MLGRGAKSRFLVVSIFLAHKVCQLAFAESITVLFSVVVGFHISARLLSRKREARSQSLRILLHRYIKGLAFSKDALALGYVHF
jgi:positive regulator of sigma E activity